MSNRVLSLGAASSAAAGIVVSAATNATPIVITFNAGTGLKNGDRLAIAGVTGNTNANGEWTLAGVTATTAQLFQSVGNGTFGGTVRAAVIYDVTPFMKTQSCHFSMQGNGVGTVDIEVYDNLADFAAGANAGLTAIGPIQSPSVATNSAGSVSTPAKSTLTMTAANACLDTEAKMSRYMRMNVTTYTSGTFLAVCIA